MWGEIYERETAKPESGGRVKVLTYDGRDIVTKPTEDSSEPCIDEGLLDDVLNNEGKPDVEAASDNGGNKQIPSDNTNNKNDENYKPYLSSNSPSICHSFVGYQIFDRCQ